MAGCLLASVASSRALPRRITIVVPPLFWFDGIALVIFSSLVRDGRRSYPNVTG
jgi:hypothetical protein